MYQNGGAEVLSRHGQSLPRALSHIYPEKVWSFSEPPLELHALGKALGVKELADWWRVKVADVEELGFGKMLGVNEGSLFKALASAYPEHSWSPPSFPYSHWKSVENQKLFFISLARQLNIEELAGFYKVRVVDVRDRGGSGLLSAHENSLFSALTCAYPEHEWFPWKFEQPPPNFWKDTSNQRAFLLWFMKENGLEDMEGWYSIDKLDVAHAGGQKLLNQYGDSLRNTLTSVFPEKNWHFWRFSQNPKGLWENEENVLQYLQWAGERLGVKSPQDWLNVSPKRLVELDGTSLLTKYGGMLGLLRKFFPENNWELKDQRATIRKTATTPG